MTFFSQAVRNLSDLRQAWKQGNPQSLIHLLRKFRGRQASDDRDKVHALLGLAPRDETRRIIPDYTIEVTDVFVKATYESMRQTQSLFALIGDCGRKYRADLPSWTPDWGATGDFDNQPWIDCSGLYNAGADGPAFIKPGDGLFISGHLKRLRRSKDLYETRASRPEPKLDNNELFISGRAVGLSEANDVDGLFQAYDYSQVSHTAFSLQGPLSRAIVLQGKSIATVCAVGASMLSSGSDMIAVLRGWFAMAAQFKFDGQTEGAIQRRVMRSAMFSDGLSLQDQIDFLHMIACDVVHFRRSSSDDVTHIHRLNGQGVAQFVGSGAQDSYNIMDRVQKYLTEAPPLGTSPEFAAHLSRSIRDLSTRRRLYISTEGFMGLGPINTAAGDEVCLLKGGRVPFVLRRSNQITMSEHDAHIMQAIVDLKETIHYSVSESDNVSSATYYEKPYVQKPPQTPSNKDAYKGGMFSGGYFKPETSSQSLDELADNLARMAIPQNLPPTERASDEMPYYKVPYYEVPYDSFQSDGQPKCYELIGDCYAHGHMDGKLMMKPYAAPHLLFVV